MARMGDLPKCPLPMAETNARRRLFRALFSSFAAHDAVPPRTDALHQLVIAVDHVDRLAQAGGGCLHANGTRPDPLLRGHPEAIVPPHAGTPAAFLPLPVLPLHHPP